MPHHTNHHTAHTMGRIRCLHFIGIGGAGMSGIAELLLTLGYHVQGSDRRASDTTRRLGQLGVKIHLGHAAAAITGADAVVISSAIDPDNPELIAARAARLPIVRRAEMLAELMRFYYGIAVAGTHGKTTTTSLLASLFAAAGRDPTFVIGGKLNSAGTHARLGTGKYLIAEADESDASFLFLQPTIAVVTNIDADHLSTYGNDFNRLRDTFVEFLHHLPFYGLAVLCADDVEIQRILPQLARPVRTYGITADEVDLRASNIRQVGLQTHFDLSGRDLDDSVEMTLNLPGQHNVLNALAAIAVGLEHELGIAAMQLALSQFQGIGRRFVARNLTTAAGCAITLVDDYGHHPRELAATLAAARAAWPGQRLVVIFQPHRYSRTQELFDDFVAVLAAVDRLILTEVYAAGETPLAGADGRSLSRAIRSRGQVEPIFEPDLAEIPAMLQRLLEPDDVVLTLGAGDIGALAAQLPELLTDPGTPPL
ncbi:UDP-N-acetylmuramate--L-alanine ligase [Thiospirillum jenense]|uniref:UDP-N-acetylmuramate--L-alanine ligase n=1 Tax=Thiospirillum jenense TaxID=1653858 RepID=A0A839HJN0_9GAMM|nr:UDP-N-acetylmuramate--L-alanine ligase [Thiospirillum jenense]MBB1126162.1 UDP-N-acetylmuramate--L-alanine ligase [Thiospirillum jenense]